MIFKRTPLALALAGAFFSFGAGAVSPVGKFHALHLQPQHIDLSKSNPLIGADGKAAVIIKLKGEPATQTYARALRQSGNGPVGTTSANNAARTSIANLKSEQATLVSQLNAEGVAYTEIYRVQRVLNAVAVRMKPADMQKVRAMPNVEAVEFLPTYKRPANIASVPFVNAPKVWDGYAQLGLPFNATGTGVKVGDIDTGLDYIHPDFGGSGTLAAYQDVDPTKVIGQNSHNIIFPTAKVAGGYDFAGDAYNASNAPQPDANPMDCGGHGTHTAGTIAGIGVNSDGTPYGGPWNTTAPYAANLKIGPGVAPGATLYALRVFGCGGSTNLVTQAIDWATDPNNNGDLSDHLDVINMSLGSPFGVDIGTGWNSDIEAVNNAAAAGLISVSAAGNSGDTFFIAGAPGAANTGLMVAASVDNGQIVPFVQENAAPNNSYPGQASAFTNASGIAPPAPGGQSANIVLANDTAGGAHRGCGTGVNDPAAFSNAAALSGNIALIDRGTCSFYVKVLNAQLAGAIGVIVDNNANTGLITMGNTGTTLPNDITIPSAFISQASGTALKTDIGAVSLAGGFNAVSQPQLADTLAGFSSRGPVAGVNGALELKPDLAAPGLNIPSAQTGFTCNGVATTGCITPSTSGIIPGGQALTISGTSMATPHVAGMVALLRQLNPTMTIEQIKALAINAASHDVFSGASSTPPRYGASRVGAGRIDAAASATSTMLAYNADVPDAINVTFDVEPVGASFTASHNVTLRNLTATAANVTLAVDNVVAAPGVSYSVPSGTITVPANGTANVVVTLNADTTAMKWSLDPSMSPTQSSAAFAASFPREFLSEDSSVLRVLDSTTSTELARVPLYAAHRPHSTMATAGDLGSAAPASGTTNLTLSGSDVCTPGVAAGPTCPTASSADEESLVSVFELQVTGAKDATLPGWANLHYFGVNTKPDTDSSSNPTTDYFFGVATHGNWGTPNYVSVNVCVDSNNDGLFDKIVANTNAGTIDSLLTPSGTANDVLMDLWYDNVTGNASVDYFYNLVGAG
ncbi:MAG TPA: S8 family serine peptidase, partial [Rudaea sp.]|nr:S8 family serine peptidase [Rudaea sp.]